MQPVRRLTAVDVGSGYGSGWAVIENIMNGHGAPQNVRITLYAIDKSAQLLARLQKRGAQSGIPVQIFRYDLDTQRGSLPPFGTADIVILSFVLTHVRSVPSVLRLAVRLAKGGAMIVIADNDYASAVASGDDALIRTVALLRDELRHPGFADLDDMAAASGLRRCEGQWDGTERFGGRGRDPKYEALGFVANFKPADPVRRAWEEIRGGTLLLRQIRRVYEVTTDDE